MSKVNIDQLYLETSRLLLSIMSASGNKSSVSTLGFFIGLLKQGKLIYSLDLDIFKSAYDLELELDEINRIKLSDVCGIMITSSTILNIVRTVNSISDLDHAKLYEAIITNYFSEERNNYDFFQPLEVTHFVTSLIKTKEFKSIYNPFAGIASYQIDNASANYYSQEVDRDAWIIGKIRLLLNNINSELMCENSLELWKGDIQNFDAIVATPPFSFSTNRIYNYTKDLQYKHKYLDSYFIEKSLRSITEYGTVISIVPIRFLQGNYDLQFRKMLVNKHHIQKIILLPKNIFYGTSIPTAVIELTNNPNANVMMVDGTSLFKEVGRKNVLQYKKLIEVTDNSKHEYVRITSFEEIIQNNFNLDPSIYLNNPLKSIVIPEGFKLKRLGDLIKHYYGRKINSGEIRLVRGKDLSEELYSFDKTFEELELEEISQKSVVLEKNLLLLLRTGNLKPTLFHYKSEFEVCCNQNIFAFDINTDEIYPLYLVNELSKDYVSLQVKAISRGSVMNYITYKELLEIKVLVPDDYKTQKVVYENDKHNYLLSKAKELNLENVIEKLKSEYLDEIRMRKHDMKPYIRELRSSYNLMKHYSTNDSYENIREKIEDIMIRQKVAIDNLSKMIDRLADEDVFGAAEKINIDQYFYNLEVNHSESSNFDIQCEYDIRSLIEHDILTEVKLEDLGIMNLSSNSVVDFYNLYIKMDPNDLDIIVTNIITNAKVHGFIDDSRNDYEVWINISIDNERDMFQIDFRNNGELLPKGLNKKRFGLKGERGGTRAGSGLGGYKIRRIVEHYGGDYDIFCEPEKNMAVTVRVLIPIFRDDEKI